MRCPSLRKSKIARPQRGGGEYARSVRAGVRAFRRTSFSSSHKLLLGAPPSPTTLGGALFGGRTSLRHAAMPPNADEDDGAGAVGSGSSRPGLGTREAAVRRDESFGRSGERAARSGEPERGRGGLSRRLARPRRFAVGFANRGAGVGAGAAGCRTSASSSDGEGGRVRRGVTRGRKGAASAAGRSGWWWGARGTTAGVRLR